MCTVQVRESRCQVQYKATYQMPRAQRKPCTYSSSRV